MEDWAYPSHKPLHDISEKEEIEAIKAAGSPIIADELAVQPLSSVMVYSRDEKYNFVN